MSVIPNQRKTYMMLAKENAEKYILEPETNRILITFDTTYPSKVKVEHVDEDPRTHEKFYSETYTTVNNAMFTFRFPEAFINSKNRRWVEIHHCKVIYSGAADLQDIILHSDIVQRDAYLDHSIMNVNETRTKYKKYEYTQQKQHFTIWFTSFAKPTTEIKPEEVTFMCEMMLIY